MRMFLKYRHFLLLALLCVIPAVSFAQVSVGVAIHIGPPALPVYEQPPCPVEGYLWTPGYWAYGPYGYYWVPGVWVSPPRPGFLWTPGYWGFEGGGYGWHAGYWGPHVGFYGGINYGFGYGGVGFVGGEWRHGVFAYNTAVVRVNETVVRNVYVNKTVINNTTIVNNHTSFNGEGGVTARPSQQEQMAMREQHVQPTSNQMQHEHVASQDRNQWASSNHGAPGTAAMDSVNGRRFNQQGRIAQGVRSGQLTPHETSQLEHQQAHINHQVATDRSANGGTLTAQERNKVNHEQNQASKNIYKDKHNNKSEHPANEEHHENEERR
ncbi:MAG TPA: YXWGXW repeat-containing protein [Candidatus Acidoferrales bacterium]|nr:YXWGXW repeat-containing protein [Candidatus Acidoferrales bacterium]